MKKNDTHHHPFPMTRRGFLSQGLIAFSGATFLPSLGFLSRNAFADDCGGPAANRIPFLIIDCAGGAALPANFLVTNEKNDLLKSYDKLGWNPYAAGAIDKAYGLPMAAKESKILQGINQAASVEARARLRMAGICHFAQSDSDSNLLSAAALLSKYEVKGTLIGNVIGTNNSKSGGNSQAALPAEAFKAFAVTKVTDLTNAVSLNPNSNLGKMNKNQLATFFKTAKDLNNSQLKAFESSTDGKLLAKLMRCSFIENQKNLGEGAAGLLDARLDPVFQTLYQINKDTPDITKSAVFASLVRGALLGVTGPAVLTIGDCDYHQNNVEKSDAKDLEIGQAIGQAVEAAHLLKKPLFFSVITDGGCSNTPGTRLFTSDDNDKCMTVMGYYRPEGPAPLKKTQVGAYTEGQSADLTLLNSFGKNPARVACAVFANYLSLHVPLDPNNSAKFHAEFNTVVPSDMFPGQQKEVEELLVFG